MGLLSLLNKQKECRVVLLINDSEDVPPLEFITSKDYTLLGIGGEEISDQ